MKKQKADAALVGKNLGQLLNKAVAFHRQGKLAAAEEVYEKILTLSPNHFDALHLLGVARIQKGRNDEGVELISAALRLKNSPEALRNLAIALGNLNRHDEAVAYCDKALALKPDDAKTVYIRADTLKSARRYEEAIAGFDAALAIKPDYIVALNNRGNVLRRLGRWEEALASYDKALEIKPNYLKALNNRGITLGELSRFDEAIASYDRALAIQPEYAEAFNNRGNALASLGLYNEAVVNFDRALKIKPDYAEVFNNLGNTLASLNRPEEAIRRFDRALELKPDYVEALINRGGVLGQLKRHQDALSSYNRALEFDPKNTDALNNVGVAQSELGRHEEALRTFSKVLTIKPDFASAHSNRVFTFDRIPGRGFAEQQEARRAWYQAHGSSQEVYRSYPNSMNLSRKLVVGYVSSDFRLHSAASTFGPILRNHDRERFEVVCYSGVIVEDSATDTFRRLANKWRSVKGLTDEDLATYIRGDEVDILVDLSGHTAGNRLQVFARKPAPIQVTAWGHATGTGLPTIDYLFSDRVAVPETVRSLFAEAVYDLPCLITFDAPNWDSTVSELPARSRGVVTFGCLNRFNKVSPAVLGLWARILCLLPGARLLLKDTALDDLSLQAAVLHTFETHGVEADRIELRGRSSHQDHLDAFKGVDIALDPYPQNGGVSTWEALWMGVPVVAKLGNSLPSRLSGAILSAVGLTDWVTEDDDAYVALAVKKACNLESLVRLRNELRSVIISSPAGNPILYTRAVEEAYRKMWRQWCASR